MKSVALITEYNPFHNGHVYHAESSRNKTNSDVTISIMSGSFTMRGEPAILNKFKRAEMAIQYVDLVVELPLVYAISSGDLFAKGGVQIAEQLQCDALSFGSESGNIEDIKSAIHQIEQLTKDDRYQSMIKEGKSHPRIIAELVQDTHLLKGSNNLLAIEYVKHIMQNNLSIKPVTIQRKDNMYLDPDLNRTTHISSATSIRNAYFNHEENYKLSLPQTSSEILSQSNGLNWEHFFTLLKWTILRSTHEELREIYMMTEGLEYKIKKEIKDSTNFEMFVKRLKSKRYTWTRLQRLLTAILLNIKTVDVINYEPSAIRVLAMSQKGQAYLKSIKDQCPLPIITNVNKQSASYFTNEIKATELYQMISGDTATDFNQPVYIKDLGHNS
ncbi:nucleotidyltransferase [Mammaliicoccus vitulinus]|uniref:tRNA(Met) cytidine acetate ligase n=1 Tax=Mammaliicoccus vitulinus TaxID=71237 RepID=A0ABX7HEY4_9STAP|nr:nucleotidyltransferase [Mammaliicoccus vitulinus]PNZ40961.1 nucleotidyltransferase [Mammaliicoccus vitulinus]QRO85186.1 nucleotidyltransferase [Mammaliicoccus vitulinus]